MHNNLPQLKYFLNKNFSFSGPDGHKSNYPLSWLSLQSFDSYSNRVSAPTRILWKGSPDSVARVSVKSYLETDEGLAQLMKSLTSLGVGLVEGVSNVSG